MGSGGHASFAVRYEGDIDRDRLSQSFRLLCTRHPVLRGRLRDDAGGKRLYVPDEEFPELVVIDGDESILFDLCHQSNSDFMARLFLVCNPSGGYVLHTVNHGVCALNLFSYMAETWELYTRLVHGESVLLEPDQMLPMSAVELMARDFEDIIDLDLDAIKADVEKYRKECNERFLYRFRANKNDTARLREAARRCSASVETLVAAELGVMVRSVEVEEGVRSMTFLTTVDFRNHLKETVDASRVTMLTGNQSATVAVSRDSNPSCVAGSLRQSLRAGVRARRDIHFPQLVAFRHHSVDIMTNNGGILPDFMHPESIEVVDVIPMDVPPKVKKLGPAVPTKASAVLLGINGELRVRLCCALGLSEADTDRFAQGFSKRFFNDYGVELAEA